jgi:hypothetical protein
MSGLEVNEMITFVLMIVSVDRLVCSSDWHRSWPDEAAEGLDYDGPVHRCEYCASTEWTLLR